MTEPNTTNHGGTHRDLLTPTQLADRWGVTTGHLANLRHLGEGIGYLKIGTRVAYRYTDVIAIREPALHRCQLSSPQAHAGRDRSSRNPATLESQYFSPLMRWRRSRAPFAVGRSRSMTAGRPQSAPWFLGDVTARPHPTVSGRWVARGKYRNADGKRFDATASGDSAAKAKRALQAKLEQHRHSHRGGDATLNQNTPVERAARLWLEAAKRKRVRGKPLAPRTLEQYAGNLARYVEGSTIATRKLSSANNVSVIEHWLAAIADAHGNGAAQSARKVLSNTLAHAERQGAIAASVMSRVQTPSASIGSTGDRKCLDPDCDLDCSQRHLDTRRAFTEAEVRRLFATVEEGDSADISDLMSFLFGTGVRIREALEGVAWDDVDIEARTVRVRGTKTVAADRVLALSDELAASLTRRAETWGTDGLVFGTTRFDTKLGRPREVGNVLRGVRRALSDAGLSWAGSHTFRRTVATWMDADGAPLAEIANQLGHADVNTTAGYLGRRQAPTRAASVMTLSSPGRPTE